MCGYFHNEKVLEEHLDPARPKPQHEDITDVMLGLAKDRTTVIHLAKDHMKAILLVSHFSTFRIWNFNPTLIKAAFLYLPGQNLFW